MTPAGGKGRKGGRKRGLPLCRFGKKEEGSGATRQRERRAPPPPLGGLRAEWRGRAVTTASGLERSGDTGDRRAQRLTAASTGQSATRLARARLATDGVRAGAHMLARGAEWLRGSRRGRAREGGGARRGGSRARARGARRRSGEGGGGRSARLTRASSSRARWSRAEREGGERAVGERERERDGAREREPGEREREHSGEWAGEGEGDGSSEFRPIDLGGGKVDFCGGILI